MINLTPDEMKKFAIYCAQESESFRGLAEQADKLGGPAREMLSKHLKQKCAAYAIVAQNLMATEIVEIGPKP